MNNKEEARLQAMALGKPLSEAERLQAMALGGSKMDNKEAVKAFLEGKTLRIINKTKQHQTYRFNKEAIAIELIGHNLFFSIHDFVSDNEWEEVKEPIKIVNEFIKTTKGPYGRTIIANTLDSLPDNKTYRVTIEEII